MYRFLFMFLILLMMSCGLEVRVATPKSVEKDYTIQVGEVGPKIYIRYLGMLSPSTFAINRFPCYDYTVPIYYPVGIDTVHDGSKSYLVKEITPKYITLHRIK
jgi:hypothetical protein